MKPFGLTASLVITTLMTNGALASIDGIFWNPSQPGTGWNCSSQNDTLFCLLYGYEAESLQPTFRSIIANLSYTVLASGDLRVSATGDVYRTTNFTNTVRVGGFSGTYQAGVFSVNAAGLSQSLVPFNFAFPREFDTVTGIYLVSTVPLPGSQGRSDLYAIDDDISVSNGTPFKIVLGSGQPVGVMLEFPGVGLAIYQTSLPLPQVADVTFLPSTPVGYGVLQGVESWKGRIGFGCRVVVATGICTTSPVDAVMVPIANSTGEAQVFVQYLPTSIGASFNKSNDNESGAITEPGASISLAAQTGSVLLETLVKRHSPASGSGAAQE